MPQGMGEGGGGYSLEFFAAGVRLTVTLFQSKQLIFRYTFSDLQVSKIQSSISVKSIPVLSDQNVYNLYHIQAI